jgi:hypothetical protein
VSWAPFASSVPIYYHVPVVLGLLGLHGGTVRWAVKRIRALEMALQMREILLGDELESRGATIVAGGTYVITPMMKNIQRIRIWSKHATEMKVTIE